MGHEEAQTLRSEKRAGPEEVPGSRIHPQGGHNQAAAQDDDDEAEVEGEELRLLSDRA